MKSRFIRQLMTIMAMASDDDKQRGRACGQESSSRCDEFQIKLTTQVRPLPTNSEHKPEGELYWSPTTIMVSDCLLHGGIAYLTTLTASQTRTGLEELPGGQLCNLWGSEAQGVGGHDLLKGCDISVPWEICGSCKSRIRALRTSSEIDRQRRELQPQDTTLLRGKLHQLYDAKCSRPAVSALPGKARPTKTKRLALGTKAARFQWRSQLATTRHDLKAQSFGFPGDPLKSRIHFSEFSFQQTPHTVGTTQRNGCNLAARILCASTSTAEGMLHG